MRIFIYIFLFLSPFYIEGQSCATIGNAAPSSGKTIPERRMPVVFQVVVHIVYASEEENLSDEQIRSQIDILNRDFSGQTPGQYRISRNFRDMISTPGWQFCLASEDPEGNTSSGIVRVNTSEKDIANPGSLMRGLRKIKHSNLGGSDAWDTDRYINIWVGSTGDDVVIGEATFPMTAKDGEDGIMIDYRVFGGIGTSLSFDPFHLGKTLTHEMGHYFNLIHLSGNGGCEVDDGVEDTPEQAREYFECPDTKVYSCGTEDMVQNFLSLASDPCLLFFTRGQVDRMNDALTTYRSELLGHSTQCAQPEIPDVDLDEKFVVISSPQTRQILLHFRGYTTEQISIRLIDLSGKELMNDILEGYVHYPISTEDYPNGIYILEVELDNKKKAIKVII